MAGQLLRMVACAAAVLVIAAAPSTLGSRAVVGGTAIDVRNAPWSVLVVHLTQSGDPYLCSGSILDPTHVLTAGHCVFDTDGSVAPTHSFVVRAGVSDGITPTATDHLQDRLVAAVRVHPGFHDDPQPKADDVAVLTLASPLDLSGPTAQAIALPPPGLRLAGGAAVSLAGYGVTSPAGDDGAALNRMSSTLVDDSACMRTAEAADGGVVLCAFSGTNSPCFGDSGSALVLPGTPPVAIGVASAATCSRNTAAMFADLTAPEILQFVQGDDDPPLAPRNASPPVVTSPTTPPQVGETVRCGAGTWSESPSLAYLFYEGTSGTELSGGSSRRLRIGDANFAVGCRVTATSAGGTSVADSRPTALVAPPPDVSVAAASARAGSTAVLRVRLVGWVHPVAGLTVCAAAPASVAARTCRTAASAGSAIALRLAVRRTARAGKATLTVSARTSDGRSAAEPATLLVR